MVDDDTHCVRAVAKNPNLTDALRLRLARDPDSTVISNLIQNPSTSPELLRRFISDERVHISADAVAALLEAGLPFQ